MAGIGRTQFSGNASATTLVNELTAVGIGTISVADSTNWPNGAIGNFTACIDRGGALEEKVRCEGSSGTVNGTVTIIAGGRGYDGTVAVDHQPGAPVELVIDAATMTDLEGHLYDNTLDYPGHQQYLNAARHDVAGRHTFGNALPPGLLADMATMSPLSGTGAAGSSGHVPDAGHTHPLGVPLIGDVTTTTPGDVAAVGASGHFADAAHRHANGISGVAWTTYTPTWSASPTPPALGNGTLASAWMQIGKKLDVRVTLVAGSTTTYGSGQWTFSLPNGLTAVNAGTFQLGTVFAQVHSAGAAWQGIAIIGANATTFSAYTSISSTDPRITGVAAASPFTWAANDVLVIKLSGIEVQ